MAKKSKGKKTRKRIYNPKTGKYYALYQRGPKKGKIKGKWSPKK